MDSSASINTSSVNATQSTLASYVQKTLQDAKTNRTRLHEKWQRNYAAANVDEDFDALTWKKKERKKSWKSDSYVDVTRQKVTAFMSLAQDAIFRGAKVPFMLDPDPSVVAGGMTDASIVQQAVEQNQALIQRQHAKTDAIKEMIRCLLSGAVYGEYYAKRFVTDIVDVVQQEPYPNVIVKQITRSPAMAMEFKSVWNIWWERESKDIQKSDYVFERTMMSASQIKGLGWKPNYLKTAIRLVTERVAAGASATQSAADTSSLPPGERGISVRKRNTEVYECWLWVPREAADSFERENDLSTELQPEASPTGADTAREKQPEAQPPDETSTGNAADESDKVYVFCVMAEGEIIAYKREPGDNPYFGDVFEECIDSPDGRGIADNMESWQRSLNGAVRSFENNTKLIANFIIAVQRRLLNNKIEDQIEEGGVLELHAECDDARKAVQQMVFQDITAPLIKAIEMFMEFSDLASNVPRAQQGQQSDNAQTLGEFNERIAKSGKYIGQVITRFDRLVAWDVQNRYDYIAGDPDAQVIKIPADVKALGFTSFDNRYLRVARLIQMLTTALNDPTGELRAITKIRWLWEEIGKSQDLETAQYIKTEAEMQAEQAAATAGQVQNDPLLMAKAGTEQARARELTAKAEGAEADVAMKSAMLDRDNAAMRAQLMMTGQEQNPQGPMSPKGRQAV